MLPDSIPESLWAEFRLMRKKIKHPMTEYAEELINRKFGFDINLLLRESKLLKKKKQQKKLSYF